MNNVELTGRTRYRAETRCFRKPLVVLQVERRYWGVEFDSYGGSRDYDFELWHDAQMEDLRDIK
jgi:hypothetical protein